VQALLRRWDAGAVILLRFCYGLRIAGPIVIGTCGISPWRLAFFNFIGVLIWAPLVAGIGCLAWQAIEQWIGRFRHVQIALLMVVVLAITVVWLAAQWRRR
jgi:membrane protein DedA with SNARE-associated domain